jgi:DNA mismatch endonuclease (patch repair protein)
VLVNTLPAGTIAKERMRILEDELWSLSVSIDVPNTAIVPRRTCACANVPRQLLLHKPKTGAMHASRDSVPSFMAARIEPTQVELFEGRYRNKMDRLDKSRRSWNMGRIRSRDTAPEVAVRSMLHRVGFRFRMHLKTLPSKPDIVLRSRQTVIFVHGCFWHRHESCKQCYTPKSNIMFWEAKFGSNIERDAKNVSALKAAGCTPLVEYCCALLKLEAFSVTFLPTITINIFI